MVRAKTLAVVIGLTAGTVTLAMAGPDRFIKQAVVVLGFDDAESTPSAQDLMRQGIQEYRWGHYDEATRLFEQAAKVPGLSEREQEMLARHRALMVRINKSRQEAADMLDGAQKSYEQGDKKQAESYATSAFTNPHASDDVKAEAKLLLTQLQGATGDSPRKSGNEESTRRQAQQLVASARRQLREGNLDEAESLANRAESLGVNLGRWDDTPAKVLKDVADARGSKAKPKTAVANSPSAKDRAKTLLAQAQSSYRRNELDRAEELAREAKDLNATFYFFETGPDDVLATVQKARRQQYAAGQTKKSTAKPAVAAKPAKQPERESEDLTTVAHEAPATEPAASSSIVTSDAITFTPEPTNVFAASNQSEPAPQVEPTPAEPVAAPQLATQVPPEVMSQIVQARKLIDTGHYDEAEQLIDRAESHNLDWSQWGNQPERLRRDLAAARAQSAAQTVDPRVQALELVRHGRACLESGKFDDAEKCASRAQSLKAEYRLLDDTPNQLMADVAKARVHATTAVAAQPRSPVMTTPELAAPASNWPADVAAIPTSMPAGNSKEVSRQAQNHLKKARDYMNHGQYDTAIEIAQRVKGWGLEYSMFWGDTPTQVENAAKGMKSRSVARSSRGQTQRDKAVADSLVAEARADLKAGRLDDAEQKAHQAQQLNASYSVTSDRPDSVLADVAKARRSGRSNKIAPMPTPGSAEPATAIVQSTARETEPATYGGPVFVAPQTAPRRDEPILVQDAIKSRGEAPLRIMVPVDEPTGPDNPPAEVVELLSEVKSHPLSTPLQRRTPNVTPGTTQPASSIVQTGGEWPAGVASDGDARVADTNDGTPPKSANPHDQKLESARTSFAHGNYPRARELASEVYSASRAHQPQAYELLSRVALAEQTAILQLYQAGVDSARKGDYERAMAFFTQVEAAHVELDVATEQQLRSYLRDLPGRMNAANNSRTAGRTTIADGTVQAQTTDDQGYKTGNDLGQRERARFELLVTETSLKVQAARQLLPSDPNKAIKDLEMARDQVRASGLDDTLTDRLVRRLDAAIRVASQEKQRIESENMQKLSSDAIAAQRKRELQVEAGRQKQLATLVDQANAAMKDARYAEAEEIGKKAMELAPDSPEALAVHYQAGVNHQLQLQKDLKQRRDAAILDTLIAVEEAAIPFGNDNERAVKYPPAKRWEDLSIRRKEQVNRIENSTKSPLELDIERKMSQPISVNFTETPLADIVSFLSDATQVNIVLDNHALTADGIRSDKPLSMKLANVQLKSALKHILGQLDLDYTIEADALVITTPLKRQGKLLPKSYAVTDLVMTPRGINNNVTVNRSGIQPIPYGVSPTNAMPLPSAGLGQIGMGLGGTQPLSNSNGTDSVFGGASFPTSPMLGARDSRGQQIDFQALIDLITQTISPNTWSTTGGPGTVEFFAGNNSLVINQTQAVHDQIADLLAQLRRLQDLQVAIEVRFITLNDDFFERVGIDFDVDIQSNAQKPLRSFGSRVTPGAAGAMGMAQTLPTLNLIYNDHDDDVAVGTAGGRDLTGAGTGAQGSPFTPDLKIPLRTGYFRKGAPGNFDPSAAFNFGIAFLSDIEVYMFLEAAQQNNRGNVLTAPKVTTFNGVQANVTAAEFRPFVIALIPVVSNGSVAFQPIPTLIQNGTSLSVTPVVSADRRYVRLALAPSFTSITGERRFPVSGAAGGFGGGGLGGGGGGASTAQAELVLPILSINSVATTVSVPDGGTVLMGGLKTKREIRNEYSTPILNKIPYINRLFTDTGVESSTTSLLLMVTPRIIIQEEEEELLGKNYAF